MPLTFALVLCVCVCFLLGSIPWGVVLGKLVFHTEIRSVGSGNIGTTNAFRAFGKAGGAAVFVLDFAKGLISALIGAFVAAHYALPAAAEAAGSLLTVEFATSLALFSVVCGHIFSPWLGGKGGKGAATAIGAVFVVFGWPSAVLILVVFGIIVIASRYVSLGSLCAALVWLVLSVAVFWGQPLPILLNALSACAVVWAHRTNIQRLLNHSENRIGGAKGHAAQAKEN